MDLKHKPKRPSGGGTPVNDLDSESPIGLQTLRDSGFKFAVWIIVIGSIMFFHPPIWIIMLVISTSSFITSIYYKTFTWKKMLKTLVVINLFILFIYSLFYFVGGIWAVIISHVIGVAFVIWGNWAFIKKAQTQITAMMLDMKNKRKTP